MKRVIYYTYELVAEDGRVVYVGKGHNKRMFYHRKVLNSPDCAMRKRPVYVRMLVLLDGMDFKETIVFQSEDELAVLAEEARRIKLHGFENLANSATHGMLGRKLKPESGRIISRRLHEHFDRNRRAYGCGLPPSVVNKVRQGMQRYYSENIRKIGQAKPVEACEKLRAAWRVASPERRAAAAKVFADLNVSRRGHKQTAEHAAKCAAIRLGKKLGHYCVVTRKVMYGPLGFTGVTLKEGRKYCARISDGVTGRLVHLGYFRTPDEAAYAVNRAYEITLLACVPNKTAQKYVDATNLIQLQARVDSNRAAYAAYAAKCQFVVGKRKNWEAVAA